MGILHKISSTIEKFKGLEKRQSDLIDKPGYLNEMVNANIRASGSLSKRKGWHSIAEPGLDLEAADGTVDPLLGIARWQGKNPNVDSDTLQAEVLIAKKDLNRLSIEKITFVNSSPEIVGISNTIYLNILPDESGQMIMKIGKAGSTAFSATKNLGTGKGHLDDITVQDLKDWIATLNIDLELRGEGTNGALNNGSVKAAFLLPFKSQSILRDTSFERDLYFLDVVPTPTGTSFSFFEGLKAKYDTGSKDFQNISSTVINGCTYFTTGYDKLCKYDGSKVYLAGLPTPDFGTSSTYSPSTAGSVDFLTYGASLKDTSPTFSFDGTNREVGLLEDTNTNDAFYYYLVVYEYTDAQGNTIRSNQSVKIKWEPGTINHGHRHITAVKIPTLKNGIGNPGDGFDVENIKILVYRSARVEEDTVEASSFYPITQNDSDGNPTMTATYAAPGILNLLDDGATPASNIFPSNVTDNGNNNYTFNNGTIQNDTSVDYVVYYDFTPHDDTALDQNGQNAYDDGSQGSETDLVFAAVESPDFIPVGDYPEGRHDLPPMCKYITNHQGCLVLSNRVSKDSNGNIVTDSPTEIFFS
jgi:hypothetical protein